MPSWLKINYDGTLESPPTRLAELASTQRDAEGIKRTFPGTLKLLRPRATHEVAIDKATSVGSRNEIAVGLRNDFTVSQFVER